MVQAVHAVVLGVAAVVEAVQAATAAEKATAKVVAGILDDAGVGRSRCSRGRMRNPNSPILPPRHRTWRPRGSGTCSGRSPVGLAGVEVGPVT